MTTLNKNQENIMYHASNNPEHGTYAVSKGLEYEQMNKDVDELIALGFLSLGLPYSWTKEEEENTPWRIVSVTIKGKSMFKDCGEWVN